MEEEGHGRGRPPHHLHVPGPPPALHVCPRPGPTRGTPRPSPCAPGVPSPAFFPPHVSPLPSIPPPRAPPASDPPANFPPNLSKISYPPQNPSPVPLTEEDAAGCVRLHVRGAGSGAGRAEPSRAVPGCTAPCPPPHTPKTFKPSEAAPSGCRGKGLSPPVPSCPLWWQGSARGAPEGQRAARSCTR